MQNKRHISWFVPITLTKQSLGIDQEDIGFVIDLLRNQIYSNKILAVQENIQQMQLTHINDIGKEEYTDFLLICPLVLIHILLFVIMGMVVSR